MEHGEMPARTGGEKSVVDFSTSLHSARNDGHSCSYYYKKTWLFTRFFSSQ